MTEEVDLFREYLKEEHQDDTIRWVPPGKPSDLAGLTDAEVARLYRKIAFAGKHNWDRQIELELIGRFTVALRGFSQASDRAAARIAALTWTLIGLTVVVAAFTVALFFRG